jgi:hypothetical protein
MDPPDPFLPPLLVGFWPLFRTKNSLAKNVWLGLLIKYCTGVCLFWPDMVWGGYPKYTPLIWGTYLGLYIGILSIYPLIWVYTRGLLI